MPKVKGGGNPTCKKFIKCGVYCETCSGEGYSTTCREAEIAPRPVYAYVAAAAASPKLACAICLEPFFQPRKTPCRHTFCEGCIVPVVSGGQPCPTCRAPLEGSSLAAGDDTLQELLDDLEVYCAHKQQGCAWKGPRGNYHDHVGRTCEKIAEREREKQAIVQFYRSINPPASDVVRLCVGGRVFETTKTILQRYRSSVLSLLLHDASALQRNKDGEILLDLDPDAFALILAWLRLGVVPRELSAERVDNFAVLAQLLRYDCLVGEIVSRYGKTMPDYLKEHLASETMPSRCVDRTPPRRVPPAPINWAGK